MTLDEIGKHISDASPYPLTEIRETPDHIYATLSRPMGDTAPKFTFALSRLELKEAIDPRIIIDAHVGIAISDLGALKPGSRGLPMWG